MLKIAYAGTLAGYDPAANTTEISLIKKLFWTYRNNFFLSLTRSGYYLFKAIELLKKEYGVTSNDLSVNLWGNIDDENKKQIKQFKIDDLVTIEGYKSKNETYNQLKTADVLFLPLELNSDKHNTLFIPGKVFEYFKLEKPILILSQNSDCLSLVEKSGLGIVAPPKNPEEIAKILLHYIKQPHLLSTIRPNKEFIDSCSFDEKTKQIAAIFDKVIAYKEII